MPDALLEAFQMNAFNLTTITGFFGVMFTYFALLATISAAMWAASAAFAAKYRPDSEFYTFLLLCMVALFFMQMVFLAVGIFLGCAMKQYRRVGSLTVSLLLGSYFLSIITDLNENLEFLKYFSPFKYFDPAKLLHESRMDVNYVLLSLAIIIVCITGGYVTYARRDLYI
jgi:ABC-2 type transport system permease protein